MAKRFRPSGSDSFFGDYLYQMTVPKTHFLRHLRSLIDWEKLTRGLVDCYRGKAEVGGVPYHPSVLFRMLLLSYLYKLSERQTQDYVNDSLAARYFLGLGAHEPAPDHSSLSVFKERILKKKGQQGFEALFRQVVRQAREKGIEFGKIQVVDATHSVADVDIQKDGERQEKGAKPRDPSAVWGTKGRRQVKTAEGERVLVKKVSTATRAI